MEEYFLFNKVDFSEGELKGRCVQDAIVMLHHILMKEIYRVQTNSPECAKLSSESFFEPLKS